MEETMRKRVFVILTTTLAILGGLLSCGQAEIAETENNNDSGTTYKIGDAGPSGGLIFYVNPNASRDGWKYLEAASADLDKKVWGLSGTTVSGADGTAVGTGKQNTLDIIATDTGTVKAANLCDEYSVTNGTKTYDDWYLPSKDELNLMYNNLHKKGIGGFITGTDVYWTSTEYDSSFAWYQYFNTGSQTITNKPFANRVRPIRQF
jgi:hypothetical protein